MKPKLTAPVMRGLCTVAGVVGAGACDDCLGFAYETAPPESRKIWDDVERAMRWVYDMDNYREDREQAEAAQQNWAEDVACAAISGRSPRK